MKSRAWATVVALCAAGLALGRAAPAAESPPIHPAVVRIMAAENGGASFGSGTLVAVNERFGLVVTNWHVVRDTNGFIVVTFPDGFRSNATLIRADREWDLAALAIWRPNVAPLPLASEPPRPGDWLAIAGYGKGNYRMAAGHCTQYLSPGGRLPYEMVEVATPAREGDSGGPIFNRRGELAGVLFGTGMGRTMGSYCGRVRYFLDPLVQQMYEMDRAGGNATMVAHGQTPAGGARNSVATPHESPTSTPWTPAEPRQPPPLVAAAPIESYARSVAATPQPAPPAQHVATRPATVSRPTAKPASPVENRSDAQTVSLASPPAAASADRFLGLKTFLALAGAVLITFHAVRFLGRAVG